MRLAPATLAVSAAMLLVAAPAPAATLTTDKPCYAEGTAVTLTGSGFTPDAGANVFRDNVFQGSLASPGGNIAGVLAAPNIAPTRERRFNLTAVDGANPGNQGSVSPLVTQLDVTVRPTSGSPARRRRITARGFPRGRTLRAHVSRRGKVRHVRIGRLRGACGKLKKRKRLFPRRAKSGTYTVQFDVRRRYRKSTKPRVTFRVTVFRRVRGSASSASLRERWVRVD